MAARYILRTLYGGLYIFSEFCITMSKGIKCLRVRKIGLIPERLVWTKNRTVWIICIFCSRNKCAYISPLLLLLLLSLSPLCRVPIHIFPRQTMSLGDTLLQLFCLCFFMVPLFLVPALPLLFFYVSTPRSMCAVPNMAVFCSSLTSLFPDMSLTYFLNDLEMVPVAPIITGITLAFTFHMRCISIVRSLYYYYYYYYY